MKIEIDDKHIKEAESIFIGGKPFDEERINFIKKLDTCDLLAVPGSGKTTALIAKLYCLSQKLPFIDGSGILVLAHTNHAVDEIEKKLKKHCPHLFEYPNFVGTIQNFTNKYLANQSCFDKYGSYISKNDNDLIYESILSQVKSKYKLNYFLQSKTREDETLIDVIKDISYGEDNFFSPKFGKYKTLSFTSDSGKALKEIYENLKKRGIIFFYDSYELANEQLNNFPKTKSILQKRFKYVFIDEMQDLEEFQIKIIDDVFFSESTETVIQRIGDINQSIYSSGKKIKVECDWKPRKIEYLNSSYRLTEEIASLVNGFTLDPQKDENQNPRFVVKGLNKLEKNIKPHLILFNKDTTGEQLQQKFEDLITANNLLECEENIKNGFKIIGWSTVWDKDEQKQSKDGINKIRLKDLFTGYSKESKAKKEDFDCLKKHIQLFDQEKHTLEAVRKSILNSFIRILRFEDIYFDLETKKHFRKSTLIVFIKNQGEEVYNNFKANLFDWCFYLVTKNDYENIYKKVKEYISNIFIKWNWYNEENYIPKFINKSTDFINSVNYQFIEINKNETIEKKEMKSEINIEVSSVHSVKGQTHCATMYIESAYKTPVYETNKLNKQTKTNPLFFQNHDCNKPTGKEAIKMMYVGFSRPTHLLCFAVLEDNIDAKELLKFENDNRWNVDKNLT
ncbi:hypothetical protein J2X31_000941 [Flavobacterium arsenatis]|uniref:DNA 3'-5' helicase II n=1 Tax=Flavobacterium arsenatis TaxID=1484332 RepID=A0ABU1TM47_9FLAO|nr:UvrD-helicase domain-containing protein [Flavobacterium arsenatis]MDR6966941.1 hypothetical protein [Flavobacterium arsenatis]